MNPRFTAIAVVALVCVAETAHAGESAYPFSVSSFDTRASSVVLSLHQAFAPDAQAVFASYNANFTNTSGRLSAQFGIHYMHQEETDENPLNGIAGSGIALYAHPIGARNELGMPTTAFAIYAGGAPYVIVGRADGGISVPVIAGMAFPLTPSPTVSLVPFGEGFFAADLTAGPSAVTLTFDEPVTETELDEAEVQNLIDDSIEYNFDTSYGWRAGLHIRLRVNDDTDLNLRAGAGSMGVASGEEIALMAGAMVVFRWDRVVPSIASPDDCGEELPVDLEPESPGDQGETSAQ